MNPTRVALLCVASALVFAALYVKSQEGDPVEHLSYVRDFSELEDWNKRLDLDILRSRYAMLLHYDRVVEDTSGMRVRLANLEPPRFMRVDAAARFRAEQTEAARLVRQKAQLADRFKSVLSLLRNSEQYFPTVAGELQRALAGRPRALRLVRDTEVAVLSYDVTAEKHSQAQAVESLQALASLPDSGWSDEARELRALAVSHGRAIVTRKPELDRIIAAVFEVPVHQHIGRLRDVYAQEYRRVSHSGQRFRVLMVLFTLLNAGVIAYTVLRLRAATAQLNAANGSLEERVAQRTQELTAKNSALSEAEARASAILDASLDAVFALDSDGTILSANETALAMTGFSESELVGAAAPELLFAEQAVPQIREAIREGAPEAPERQRELECRHGDGSCYPAEVSITRPGAAGAVRVICTIRDISERKRIQYMKDQFVSTVSHELRTPLTSIRGSLGLVLGGAMGEMPEEARELVEIACRNTDRLTRLINDILDLEKIESGKLDFSPETIELRPWLEEVITANHGYAEEFDVRVALECPDEPLRVFADRDRLTQVLTNLLSNASKFSPAGGEILVDAELAEGRIRVSVTDHGDGIAPEFQPRIFEKFTQAGEVNTRRVGGTGLGLSICRQMMEEMGGRIDFRSEPGKGATFFFELPAMAALAAVGPAPDARRVLVCEDDPDVAHLLALMLEADGYTVDRAQTADDARQLLATRVYRAMTLDLGLPDEDGISLLNELRSRPETAELPVVIVTNAEEAGEDLNGDALMIVDWLVKPVDGARLRQSVRTAFAGDSAVRRILHVEDDADVRRVVSRLLGEMAEVSHAGSVAEASGILRDQSFDLVILDEGLPDGRGLDLLPQIGHQTPVILFSGRNVSRDVANDVEAILQKSRTHPEQLRQTVHTILCRDG